MQPTEVWRKPGHVGLAPRIFITGFGRKLDGLPGLRQATAVGCNLPTSAETIKTFNNELGCSGV